MPSEVGTFLDHEHCLLIVGNQHLEDKGFEFLAPTTRRNVLRVLRAMQLPKPGFYPFEIHGENLVYLLILYC